jgi:hypothetical protein
MSSIQNEIRGTEITKFVSDPAQIRALREHVEHLVHGDAFRASPRSQQFLRYVVDKAIQGDFDSLKERVIGVELFHRPPSFDTGEDSIVRVTASDVRKRLLQHYGRYGDGAEVRLAIPSGSYIPEITWSPHLDAAAGASHAPETHTREERAVPAAVAAAPPIVHEPATATQPPVRGMIWLVAVLAALSLAAISFWLGYRAHKTDLPNGRALVFPWSSLLRPGHTLEIVASDPNFAAEQDITGHATALADYANGRYIPESSPISPELRSFSLKYLQGREVADIDVPITVSIAALAERVSEKVDIRSARTLRLSDFHTDDDFVLLGSPLSNPWSDLFVDQLDFRFKYVSDSSLQDIENVRPQANELPIYAPVGRGFNGSGPATGTSFGIIALVGNPNQSGRILLIAGTGAEATEAAGHLATDTAELSSALAKCRASSEEQLQHFEILLKTGIMAGSPSNSEVIACHILAGGHPSGR